MINICDESCCQIMTSSDAQILFSIICIYIYIGSTVQAINELLKANLEKNNMFAR